MTETLSLEPVEHKQRLNPCALKRSNDWQATILSKVSQLHQLSVEQVREELHTYLHDDETAEFNI